MCLGRARVPDWGSIVCSLRSPCVSPLQLGYYLTGAEYEGAMSLLDTTGHQVFTWRDFVSWWTTSARGWLFLFEDESFHERRRVTEAFLRNDPGRTGVVSRLRCRAELVTSCTRW